MGIVNATLMSKIGMQLYLGADILSKGNRTVEKMLGVERMSGDTVNVTIMDSGKVFDKLDLTNERGKLAVQRSSVPVTVKPITVAAEVSVKQLTLEIQKPDLMAKRVANAQDEINKRAFGCLLGGSQPYVATDGLFGPARDEAYRLAAFDAEAHTTGSKFSASTFGIVHPQTWNRLVPSLMGNYGANQKIGTDLFKNELGDFLGFRWTKGMEFKRIKAGYTAPGSAGLVKTVSLATGAAFNLTTGLLVETGNGFIDIVDSNSTPIVGSYDGEVHPEPVSLTFTVGGTADTLFCVDALGKSTGIEKKFFLKWDKYAAGGNGSWQIANPVFFEGPRKNTHSELYEATLTGLFPSLDPDAPSDYTNPAPLSAATVAITSVDFDVLTAGKTYLAPAVMWKEPDFLIAVKGLEKSPTGDSLTIPTEFSERGIMPWRGTYWGDDYATVNLLRIDAMFGFNMYQGVSAASVFLPID